MIIEAICDHGMVQMPADLKFKHEKFTVKIELPEAELNSARPDASSPSEIKRQLDIILEPYKDQLIKLRIAQARRADAQWLKKLLEWTAAPVMLDEHVRASLQGWMPEYQPNTRQ